MDTAEELRRQREETSAFSRLFDYVRGNEAALAAEGRRSVFGGLLSKEPVMGVDTIRYEGIGPMLAGLLEPVARGVDAPRAAAQGLIPAEDMAGEAVGTAGVAMGGGGAMPKPKGALGANALRGGGMSDPTQTGWTFKDVDRSLKTSKAENRRLAGDTSRVESVPIRQLYATQPTVNPDFATTSSSFGEMPLVVRKNGKMFVQDGHHRLTKQAEGGAQTANVRFIDLDNADTSTPLLEWSPEKTGFVEADQALLDELFAANASKSAGLLGVASDGFLGRLIGADDIPAKTDAQKAAKEILQLREQGRASEVTKEMMEQADPQTMMLYTPLDMSDRARMDRAREQGFEDQTYYHGAKDTPELPYFDSIDEYNTEGHMGTIYGTSSPAVANTYVRRSNDDEGAIYPLMVRRDASDPTINVDGVYSRIPMSIKDEKGQRLIDVLPEAAKMDYLNAERVTNTDAIANAMRNADFSMLRMENVVDRGPYYPEATPLGFKAKSYKDIDRQNEFSKWNRQMLAEANKPATNVMVQDPTKLRSRFARFDPEFSHLSNLTAANASPTAGLLSQAGMSEQQAERTEQILQRMGLLD